MRLTGILAVVLFLAIVFFAAPAASYAQSNDGTAPNLAFLADAGKKGAGSPQLPHLSMRAETDEQRDGVCFTMRTYVVARESRDSDVVRAKGYHECMPGWKLQMRTTDELNLDSSRDSGGSTPR
jgi:hypothetical protein